MSIHQISSTHLDFEKINEIISSKAKLELAADAAVSAGYGSAGSQVSQPGLVAPQLRTDGVS